MGPARSRFFAYLLANTPVRLHRIFPKSLFRSILRISHLFSIVCARNRTHLHENKDFGGRGEELRTIQCFPDREVFAGWSRRRSSWTQRFLVERFGSVPLPCLDRSLTHGMLCKECGFVQENADISPYR